MWLRLTDADMATTISVNMAKIISINPDRTQGSVLVAEGGVIIRIDENWETVLARTEALWENSH